jgi:uncharacterized protein YdaT
MRETKLNFDLPSKIEETLPSKLNAMLLISETIEFYKIFKEEGYSDEQAKDLATAKVNDTYKDIKVMFTKAVKVKGNTKTDKLSIDQAIEIINGEVKDEEKRNAFIKWVTYKANEKKHKYTEQGLLTLIENNIKFNAFDLSEGVKKSVDSLYLGLFVKETKGSNKTTNSFDNEIDIRL